MGELDRRMADVLAGKIKLVYAAPERLRQQPFVHALRRAGVSLLVVDEAHCVSLWGHDFRPDYLFIGRALAALGEPPVLAMTATATPQVAHEIGEQLGRSLHLVHTSPYRPNLFYQVRHLKHAKEKTRAADRVLPGAARVGHRLCPQPPPGRGTGPGAAQRRGEGRALPCRAGEQRTQRGARGAGCSTRRG